MITTVIINQANTGKQQKVNEGPFKKDPFNTSSRQLNKSMESGPIDLEYSGYNPTTHVPYATEVGLGSDAGVQSNYTKKEERIDRQKSIAATRKPSEIPTDAFKKNDKPRAQEFVAREISDDSDSDVICKKPVETKVEKPVIIDNKPVTKQPMMPTEIKEQPIKLTAAPVKQPIKPAEVKQPATQTAATNKPDNTSDTGTWLVAGLALTGLAFGAVMMNENETTNAAGAEYNKEEAPYFNRDIEMMKLTEESTEEPSGYMSSEIEGVEPSENTYEEVSNDFEELY